MRKAVGNKLKALRKQKRLTQKELATALDIGISQLNKYESGMHMPPIKKLIQLSNIFDTEEQDAVLKILDAMIMKNKMTDVMSMDAN